MICLEIKNDFWDPSVIPGLSVWILGFLFGFWDFSVALWIPVEIMRFRYEPWASSMDSGIQCELLNCFSLDPRVSMWILAF